MVFLSASKTKPTVYNFAEKHLKNNELQMRLDAATVFSCLVIDIVVHAAARVFNFTKVDVLENSIKNLIM